MEANRVSYFPLSSWMGTRGLVAVRSGWISGKSPSSLSGGGGQKKGLGLFSVRGNVLCISPTDQIPDDCTYSRAMSHNQ